MRIVLDTNSLLVSIPKKSPYRPIFDAIIEGNLTLIISNEILFEYVEKLEQKTSKEVSINMAKFLVQSNFVEKIEV